MLVFLIIVVSVLIMVNLFICYALCKASSQYDRELEIQQMKAYMKKERSKSMSKTKEYLQRLTNSEGNVLVFDTLRIELNLMNIDEADALLIKDLKRHNYNDSDIDDIEQAILEDELIYRFYNGNNYLPQDDVIDDLFNNGASCDICINQMPFMSFLYSIGIIPATEDEYDKYLHQAIEEVDDGVNYAYFKLPFTNCEEFYEFNVKSHYFDEFGKEVEATDGWEAVTTICDFA